MRLTDRAVLNDIRKVEDIIECILCPINKNKEELKIVVPLVSPVNREDTWCLQWWIVVGITIRIIKVVQQTCQATVL